MTCEVLAKGQLLRACAKQSTMPNCIGMLGEMGFVETGSGKRHRLPYIYIYIYIMHFWSQNYRWLLSHGNHCMGLLCKCWEVLSKGRQNDHPAKCLGEEMDVFFPNQSNMNLFNTTLFEQVMYSCISSTKHCLNDQICIFIYSHNQVGQLSL